MTYFLDASALVKRYVRETGTDLLASLMRRRGRLAASRLSSVEVPAALWRRVREGDIAVSAANAASARLTRDLADMDVVEVRGSVLELGAALVRAHPLRAYDAVQLACALRLARETGMALTFVCSDQALGAAAKREGLRLLSLA